MRTEKLFDYYGGRAKAIPVICSFLGVSNMCIYQWGEVVPAEAAIKIHLKSNKQIPLDMEDYEPKKVNTRRYK